jgi:hypothetical protein
MPRRLDFSITSLLFTLFICGVILSLTFTFPFIEDNIPQAYIARRLLHGELPYAGTWDQNYPGVLIVHLLALIIGPSAIAFHVVDVALQLLMIWILYSIGNRLGGKLAGLLAAIFYTIYYVLNGIDDLVGQKDVFAAIALAGAVMMLIKSNYRSLGSSGILAGIAVLIRPTCGIHVIVLAIAIGFASRNNFIRRAATFLLFSALPLCAFCIVYSIAGHISDFWDATFVFTTSVYNPHPRFATLLLPTIYLGVMPALAVAGSIALTWDTKHRREGLLLLGMIAASLASAILLWGYRYHWQPFFVFEQLLAAIGIATLFQIIAMRYIVRESLRSLAMVVLILTILIFNFKGSTIAGVLRDAIHGRLNSEESMYNHFASSAFDPVGETRLANYVKAKSHPGDRMESFYTTVYPQYIADLQPANRFILTIPLLMRDKNGGFTEMQLRWQKEYSDSLLYVKPRWFLISDPKNISGIGEGGLLPRQMLHETFPTVEAMISQSYLRDTSIGIWTLYERK